MPTTRLAPSPTGAMHLGNARTFVVNWILARQNGWRIILRIEDLDGPRIKRGADAAAIEDLHWLGLDWDEGPFYQLHRMRAYREALDRLVQSGQAYPCVCTRREAVLAASAPHAEDGLTRYPGTCDGKFASVESARTRTGRDPCLRFRVPEGSINVNDDFAGSKQFDLRSQLGDFVIAKSDGTPAYQLAVVVDDHEMNVTHVVRGDDLLDSTPRQMLLYRALGWDQHIPRYYHLPLVVGGDQKRLAKRHGDTRLATYRASGVPAARVLALLARWSGTAEREQIELDELVAHFRIEQLPRNPIVMTSEDDAWLRKPLAA